MDLLNSFKEAIEIQQSKQDEDFEALMDTPLQERIAKGETMANLSVAFDFHASAPNSWCPTLDEDKKFIRQAHIRCENNISKFREGTDVILSNGSMAFKMDIVTDSVDNFVLAANDFNVSSCFAEQENYPKNNWEINITNNNVTKKLLSATADYLIRNGDKCDEIYLLLNGKLRNTQSAVFNESLLNASQNDAIARALGCEHFHLIQGPPGTGKTHTIAYLTKELVKRNNKVLITGPTHTAINNCLNKISSIVDGASLIVKIGEKHQAEDISENTKIILKSRLPISSFKDKNYLDTNPMVIGATAYSVCYPASKKLDQWEFDVAIIDEASQLSVPLAIAAMSHSKKVIFVGDHKQLDPIIPKSTDNPLLAGSIFRMLADLYPDQISLLNTSYRLNEELIRIPNLLFYDNKLLSVASLNTEFTSFSCQYRPNIINSIASKVLFQHHEFDSQGKSPFEANIVAELVSDLIDNKVDLSQIGILSPYRAQVREIKRAICKIVPGFNKNNIDRIMIDTVDRMQGQEKDYIIYSLSNSHPLQSKRRLDFFYSPNRLNVAITRAIKKCIVICNYKVFDIIDEELIDLPNYAELKPSLDIFKQYAELAIVITDENNVAEVDEW